MGKIFIRIAVISVVLTLFSSTAGARTGYVSDMLLLTFRQGPGNSFAVAKTLKSNTPVKVLEEENGFFKVELESKEIGWVDKKFIIFDLPNAYIARQLEEKNNALEKKLENLLAGKQDLSGKITSMEEEYKRKIESLNAELKKVSEHNNTLSRELSQSREKYDTLIDQSKNIQNIVQENETFRAQNSTLEAEVESLQNKYNNSFRAAMIKWFLAGVGVLLSGWIIGSSVSSKKRGSSSLLD